MKCKIQYYIKIIYIYIRGMSRAKQKREREKKKNKLMNPCTNLIEFVFAFKMSRYIISF